MIGVPVEDIKVRGDWSSDCVRQYLKTPLDVRIQQDVLVAAIIAKTSLIEEDTCLLKLKEPSHAMAK